MRAVVCVCALMCALICAVSAWSAPSTFTHQGCLLDASGAPISGSRPMTFGIYDDSTSGSLLWSESHPSIEVLDGLFSVVLGSVSPVSADILASPPASGVPQSDLFLQVTVDGEDLLPRRRLTAGLYSVVAKRLSGDIHTLPDQVAIGDLDGDGIPDLALVSDPTSARLAINTKGTGAKRTGITTESAGGETAEIRTDADVNEDGLPDLLVNSFVTYDSSGVAVQGYDDPATTGLRGKGVGRVTFKAKEGATVAGRVQSILSYDSDDDGNPETFAGTLVTADSTRRWLDMDSDDDGVSDAEISKLIAPDRCGVAIKTKATGAEPVRLAASSTNTGLDGTVEVHGVDLDDDGALDLTVSSSTTATDARLAINTKGTGAKRMSAGGDCDDTDATLFTEYDDDGDGITESGVSHSSGFSNAAFSMKTSKKRFNLMDAFPMRLDMNVTADDTTRRSTIAQSSDSDEDGIPETVMMSTVERKSGSIVYLDREGNEVLRSMIAIDSAGGIVATDHDSDGDGVPESEAYLKVTPTTTAHAIKTKGTGAESNRVIGSTDDTTAVLLLATDSASITLRARKGGVIKGSLNINHASGMKMAGMDSDGNGYFHTGVGVGVEPSQPIEVAGGAFCDGTNWVNASDAAAKENFRPIDGRELLEKIDELEITRWNYRGDPVTEHIGPTAQDFQETFGVGSDGKSISTIDPSGIALAAIKQLKKENDELREEIAELKKLVLERTRR
ncbi:MAG: FG-GAP-like repeat-containing protein [candidate division Zixibacteria bacterium]|nr:FG-GAP-like repeat-containing protein [candidate division Zixibacteria bacterium]